MNTTLRRTTFLLLILLFYSSSAHTQQSLEQHVDAAVLAVMKQGVTAGTAIGVMKDGQMMLAKGYGMANIELEIPAEPENVFRIGSITKQFTAAGIMLLMEEGQLSLEDKLSKFMPDFPRADEVTIRHLLTHTSGIHSYTGKRDWQQGGMRRDMSSGQMIAYIKEDPYDFDPGAKYMYNNSAYYMLGIIIEKLSGQSLADFYKQRLFDKVGMPNTSYEDSRQIVLNRAAGYAPVQDKPGAFTNASYISMTQPGAAGGLISTVTDLARWSHSLFNGKVVKPESFRQMTTPAKLTNGESTTYGFGLQLGKLDSRDRIFHGGGINGFNSAMSTFPAERLTIVILTNSTGAARLEEAVAKAVLAFLS